jgi:flagella basal body P-ring formation protein FlgA
MHHFLWPLLLISISGADVQREILSYLEQHYPLQNGQYICDISAVNTSVDASYDSVAIDGFGKENPRGIVVARLSYYSDGKPVNRVSVSVKIGILKPVLVTTSIIKANEPIDPARVTFETRDIAGAGEIPLSELDQLTGMVASHYIPAGRAITNSMIMVPPTLKMGDRVIIKYSRGPLCLTAEGVARENGSIGNRIKVSNSLSRKIITAVVVDANTVAIGDKEEF